ncbi:MAG: metallophosphoesterase [Synergistaceae bacterium]|jgi:predicted MPP superfamily phosphohydrolase|nr:metallophosphoesterase [Synergistaceae bacterium]
MVISDIKEFMNGVNPHGKRMSDRGVFQLVVISVVILAHSYLYVTIGRLLDWHLEAIWFAVGILAIVSMGGTRLLGTPRRRRAAISPQGAIYRFGASWNVMVVLWAAFMMISTLFLEPSMTSRTISCILSFAICSYGIMEAGTVRIARLELQTEKLPRRGRLRLVQLTDLHIGPYSSLKHLSKIVETALLSGPDLIAITGDLVDGAVGDKGGISPYYEPFAEKLRELRQAATRFGVWAVPGNHDFYENFEGAAAFMKRSGVKLLRGEAMDLGVVVLAGADDLDHLSGSESRQGITKSEDLLLSLDPALSDKFVLFLRHRPIVERRTVGHFDLQLSGHTHGGQLLTLPSSRHRIPGRSRGLLSLGRGSYMYVSNGAGFVGPPMRFLAPAEIVVIDLVRD